MRKPWRITAITLALVIFLLGGLAGSRLLALSDSARRTLRVYTEMLAAAHDHAAAPVTYKDLVFASIQGMVRRLDPHTSFLPPDSYADMREKQQSSFYGLGILVGVRNGQLTVVTPLDGTPAARMGIRAGDVISMIEGDPTEKMTLDEAVHRLKGPKGTKVHITIVRPGLDQPLELDIVRAEIPQNTVRYAYMLDDKTGYIALSDFARSTGEEMKDAIAKLKSQGMQRLLFDLRGNGGGLLDQAIAVSDQFLPAGALIVETRGRVSGSSEKYNATGDYTPLEMPVVVLVSESTASAAEIVSGAIQDHDYGLIVGVPTWGKGLVQTVYSLSYGAGLALTTAKYYTPSGRLIQRDYTDFYDYAAHDESTNGSHPGEGGGAPSTYFTDLRREVYGGGGITPDIEVEPEDLPPFIQFLISRDAFFQFASEHVNRHPLPSEAWTPDAKTLDAFQKWVVGQDIANADELQAAMDDAEVARWIRLYIEAEAKGAQFGLQARSHVLLKADKQVKTAMEQFDRAANLLASRQLLEHQNETKVASRN